MDDRNFLVNAEKNQIRQKTLAQAAIEKSKSGEVVEFARQVVDNRNASLAELSRLMKAKQIAEPPTLAEEVQLDATNRLQGLSGDAFDDEFISLIAAEQQQALGDFNSASETAADPDVRNYASANLPSLRHDVDSAVALEKKLATKKQG
jgi:putative membrane protein